MPLFSQERGNADEHAYMPYIEEFTVGVNGDGGEDTYYPVRITMQNRENQGRLDFMQVFRRYSDSGPSVHGDHKAGLCTYFHGYDGGWDGGPRRWYLSEHLDTYRRTLGASEIWSGSNNDPIIHLRGGGYFYEMRMSCPFNVTIYYQETLIYRHNPTGREWYAVPRTLSEISSVANTGTEFGNLYSAGQLSGTQRVT